MLKTTVLTVVFRCLSFCSLHLQQLSHWRRYAVGGPRTVYLLVTWAACLKRLRTPAPNHSHLSSLHTRSQVPDVQFISWNVQAGGNSIFRKWRRKFSLTFAVCFETKKVLTFSKLLQNNCCVTCTLLHAGSLLNILSAKPWPKRSLSVRLYCSSNLKVLESSAENNSDDWPSHWLR